MGEPSKVQSSDEEQIIDQTNAEVEVEDDEQEIEAVARTADSDSDSGATKVDAGEGDDDEVFQKKYGNDYSEVDEEDDPPLTAEENEEKLNLLEEGFSTWTRGDFNAFLRACEKFGRDDVSSIALEMEGKSVEEVERYMRVFKARYTELNDYDRIIKNIERGEARIARRDEIMKAIGKKMGRYKNPWDEMTFEYNQHKSRMFSEESDRYLICLVYKLGYGKWDELKWALRTSTKFRFDWFIKSRSAQELGRRCDTLVRMIERENQEHEERERRALKEKSHAAKEGGEDNPLLIPLKKRKQASMDDCLGSVCP